ncbi:MAG TPA: HD domain-containing protein [Anaerolineae bacterium]|nr:HD domain-containing protein [Anaerolineae bacterium]
MPAYTAGIIMETPTVVSPEDLLRRTAVYLTPPDQNRVKIALSLAEAAHHGRFRLDNSPYIHHPLAVADQLAQCYAPADVLAAALLHDVLKKKYAADVTLADIDAALGETVARLVDTVACLGRYGAVYPAAPDETPSAKMDALAARMPWAALILQREPLAVVIKLADKVHNFQSLHVLSAERQIAFATGVRGVFVPFAERLGLRRAKQALEDDAFRVLQPEEYQEMESRYPVAARQEAAAPLRRQIEAQLAAAAVSARVFSHSRSFYEIYQLETAVENRQMPLHVVDPLIIVPPNEADCYRALGVVHSLWPPQLGKMWDYIAAPKPNAYRALHSRVRLPDDTWLQLVIRDEAMQVAANHGITAVWRDIPVTVSPTFADWREPPEGQIGVLTPDGDFKMLPEGATPIDFAYAIHSGLGHQCTGAMVNGRQVPLDTPLQTGDVVRILTGKASVGPSPDWLASVKTSRARQAIRRWLKLQKPGDAAEKGWSLLDQRLRLAGMILASSEVLQQLDETARRMGYASRNDLFVAIGLRRRAAAEVVKALQEGGTAVSTRPALQATVLSLDNANLPQQLAACCRPQPPDPIVGYQTARGVVTIHRADCATARRLRPVIQADWSHIQTDPQFEIHIQAIDRRRLVQDIAYIIGESNINMTSFHADQMPDGSAQMVIGLSDMPPWQRDRLLNRLRRVPEVRRAESRSPTNAAAFSEQSVMARHFENPYTLRPVTGESFYGRRQELRALIDNLRDVRPGEAVLLWGPRRIGKTSLLREFQQQVINSEDYLLAFVDMQRLSGRSTTMFLRDIIKALAAAVADERTRPPSLSRMKRDPLGYFRGFLENSPPLQERVIVIILDEFQLLSSLQEDSVTLADINRYLRSLIQHRGGLSIIFSGGGVLDHLLAQPEASFMLEVARHQKVDCLDAAAARDLIVRPAPRIQYDGAVVDRLLALTAGHPYYLQWMCGELVLQADRVQRPFVRPEHLDDLLALWAPFQGEQFFNHLWGASTGFTLRQQEMGKLALAAAAAHAGEARWFDLAELANLTAPHLDETQLWHVCQDLVKMDTLTKSEDRYCIRMPLFQLWMQANYTVERVVKEMRG